jgi:hypothetical protein
MSFLMSSSHLFFGLPISLLNIGFHLYTFLSFFLVAFVVNGQTNLILVIYVIYYVLMSDTLIYLLKCTGYLVPQNV